MATIKNFTSLEQSRKLAEILPLESADMVILHEEPYETSDSKFDGLHQTLCVPFSKYDKSWRQKYKNISYFPCWSLVALLDILPTYLFEFERGIDLNIYPHLNGKGWHCSYMPNCIENMKKDKFKLITSEDNLVDACYEMILKLHELNLL